MVMPLFGRTKRILVCVQTAIPVASDDQEMPPEVPSTSNYIASKFGVK
jgi:hypothetical protein